MAKNTTKTKSREPADRSSGTKKPVQTIFQSRVFSVIRQSTTLPSGLLLEREVIHHGGSAVILPVLEDGRVVLIRQFRLAAGSFLWELPAGSIEPGEPALACAKRELAEETGYRASSWRKLVEFFPSPGFLDEKMTVFLAGKVRPGKASPEEDEQIHVQAFDTAEWQSMIRSAEIRDAKTLVGLLFWNWNPTLDRR